MLFSLSSCIYNKLSEGKMAANKYIFQEFNNDYIISIYIAATGCFIIMYSQGIHADYILL